MKGDVGGKLDPAQHNGVKHDTPLAFNEWNYLILRVFANICLLEK